MCKTYDFAKQFINLYHNVLKILKFSIILTSFIVSIIYNIKFRNDFSETVRRNYNKNNNLRNKKKIDCNMVIINYSTKDNKEKMLNS